MSLLLTLNIFQLETWWQTLLAEERLQDCLQRHIQNPVKDLKWSFLWKKSKVTSHCIFHYLLSPNPSKSFSQLIMSIFIFSQCFFQQALRGGKDYISNYLFSIFFSIDFPQWKSMVLPHFAYFVIQSLTISAKKLILDIWQGSKHSSGLDGRRYLINIYLFRVRLRHWCGKICRRNWEKFRPC